MWKNVRKYEISGIILAIIIIAMIIMVAIKSPTLEYVLLAGLIGVTTWYAYSTIKIAKATKQQADASVKMAEEMREQRYSDSLPILVPTIPPILSVEKLPIEAMRSGNTVKVVWGNVGKGVAINTRFSFWAVPTSPERARFFPPGESITLEVNGRKKVDYSKILNDAQTIEISKAYHPRLEAEYQDIHERKITTVQEFRIDEENERVSLGDLYFTINGRRLGEEVTEND